MFSRFRESMQHLMDGRNGVDRLAWILVLTGLVLNILGTITKLSIFTVLAYIPLILALYRIFSRDIVRRQAENTAFLQFASRLKGRRYYHYYRCPDCKTRVRVPRKKGKLRITCPACRNSFVKKS